MPAAIDRGGGEKALVRCASSARLTRPQITPAMTRLSGSAKASTRRIRRAEMLRRCSAARRFRPAKRLASSRAQIARIFWVPRKTLQRMLEVQALAA